MPAYIRTVKYDLAGWNLSRMVWVADRGFASAANRAYLTRGGGHCIHAEKLRNTNSEAAAALPGPAGIAPSPGTCRVKEFAVAPDGQGDGDDGARTQRFVVCHNPEQAERDAAVREQLVAHGRELACRVGRLERPASRRSPRQPEDQARAAPLPAPHRRWIAARDAAAVKREARLDGKWAAAHVRHHPDPG
jgi:hypothetical protein